MATPPRAATTPGATAALSGVSCTTGRCTAVGYYTTNDGDRFPMAASQP